MRRSAERRASICAAERISPGAFAIRSAVFCDVAALRTLPPRGLREGLAEIVKAAIIEGGEFFEALEELAPHPLVALAVDGVIDAAVKVKTMIVADDRLEAGYARDAQSRPHVRARDRARVEVST